jgi:hypothetical protein
MSSNLFIGNENAGMFFRHYNNHFYGLFISKHGHAGPLTSGLIRSFEAGLLRDPKSFKINDEFIISQDGVVRYADWKSMCESISKFEERGEFF